MINLNSFCNALALNIKNKKKRKNLKIYDLKPVLYSCHVVLIITVLNRIKFYINNMRAARIITLNREVGPNWN